MADRFEIKYDERGRQLHNEYIGRIAAGIIEYDKRHNIPVDNPDHIYGMIHKHRLLLEFWEDILTGEGLL